MAGPGWEVFGGPEGIRVGFCEVGREGVGVAGGSVLRGERSRGSEPVRPESRIVDLCAVDCFFVWRAGGSSGTGEDPDEKKTKKMIRNARRKLTPKVAAGGNLAESVDSWWVPLRERTRLLFRRGRRD